MSTPSHPGDSWTNLNSLIRALGGADGILGRIKDSLEEFLKLTEVYERFESTRDEYGTMKQELESIFHQLSENCAGCTRLSVTECIKGLCRDLKVELTHIRHYSFDQPHDENTARVSDSMKVLAHYRHIQATLQALVLNTDPSTFKDLDQNTGLRTPSSTFEVFDSTLSTEHDPSIRPTEVRRLHSWVPNSPPGAVCWVPDPRHTNISRAICAELDATHKLCASVFLSSKHHDLNSLIPSIADQLGNYSAPFRLALSKSPLRTPSESLDVQFEELIANPLTRVRAALPANLVVVIDLTNECESVRPILDAILAKSTDLPIKFIVCSRPEPDYHADERLFVREVDRECVIEGYGGELSTALKPLGLSELQLAEFVQRAGILFAYAATVARAHYIGDDASWLNSPTISVS